jgi:hypothetical protein
MTSLTRGFQHGGSSLPPAPWQIRRAPGIGDTLLETETGVGLMLATGQAAATLAVSDVDRARKFYTETLGFTPMMEDPAMGTLYGGSDPYRANLDQSSVSQS